MGRFQDNVTLLDAATLNKLEEDIKQLCNGLPIFNATLDSTDNNNHTYKIADENFNSALKSGYVFVIIPNISSQGSSHKSLNIKFGSTVGQLYWNNLYGISGVGQEIAYVDNKQYLEAGKPYIIKCLSKTQSSCKFIIMELYKDAAVSGSGNMTIRLDGSTLIISTN